MTLTRAIATRPGLPTVYEDMTPEEEAARGVESDAAEIRHARQKRQREFNKEGLARIAVQVPAWNTFEEVSLIASIWARLGPADPEATLAKNIYLYVRNDVPSKLGALSELNQLEAVDPTAADPFGDGTPWPT